MPGDGDTHQEAQALEVWIDEKTEGQVNPWITICKQVAEGTPSEQDYIYRNWCHTHIAYEHLQNIKQMYQSMPDD